MATVRPRQTKKGIVYDIQVKVTDRGSGEQVTKTTVFKPEPHLKPKQQERAAEDYAEEFENQIKDIVNSAAGIGKETNPNISFREYAAQVIKNMEQTLDQPDGYSHNYYVKFQDSIAFANQYIGGYKVKDITPAIIQNFYNLIDKREKEVVKITPVPAFKEVLASYGFTYKILRYEKNVQSCTLSRALNGKCVSKGWAVSLCKKTSIPFFKLFDEITTTEQYAYETNHQIKRVVRAVLFQAKKERIISICPASGDYVEFPKKPKKKIRYMDDETAQKFIDALGACQDIRAKTGMCIFLYTGFRRGEVTGLKWSAINLDRRFISVDTAVVTCKGYGTIVKGTKTDESERGIYISEHLVSILREYRAWWLEEAEKYGDRITDDWLFFQSSGKVCHPGIFNAWLNRILDDAGIEHYNVHSLRHTNISILLASGVPIHNVSQRAGHAKTSTTMDIYGHAMKSGDVAAAQVLDKQFGQPQMDKTGLNEQQAILLRWAEEQMKQLGFKSVAELVGK